MIHVVIAVTEDLESPMMIAQLMAITTMHLASLALANILPGPTSLLATLPLHRIVRSTMPKKDRATTEA
jgi:hypothetical protein